MVGHATHGRKSRNVQRHLEKKEIPSALHHEELAVLLGEGLNLLLCFLGLDRISFRLFLLCHQLLVFGLQERLLARAANGRYTDWQSYETNAETRSYDCCEPRAAGIIVNVNHKGLEQIYREPRVVFAGHICAPCHRCL